MRAGGRSGQYPGREAREHRPGACAVSLAIRADTARALSRKDRIRLYFGTEGGHWDEERVLDRYELLYEAGLTEEARRD